VEQIEVDFDEWIKNYKPVETKFWAVYNPKDGSIVGVYPEGTVAESTYKILIDTSIARLIQENHIRLSSCYVDPVQQEFVILYDKNIVKIDDVLHRIPTKQWSTPSEHDVYIEYYKKDAKLVIALTEKFYGTRPASYDFKTKLDQAQVSKISLIITEYNDPNILDRILNVNIEELVGKEKVFTEIKLPEKFSVYTRRLFKNYILEIK
jgi:hypothetical protein